MVAPQYPLASPCDGGADAVLRQLLAGLLVEAAVVGVGPEILLDDGDGLVAAGLHRDAVVAEVSAHKLDHGQRAQVEHVAEVVHSLRPVDLRTLVGEGVGLLPCDRLGDRVDRLRGAVHEGQVGHDEGVPVAVDLLAGRQHGVVDGRAVTPAGGRDQIADRELLGIEQRDRAQAAVLAGGGDAADDVAVCDLRVVHLAEAGRQAAGELRVVLQAGDDDRALGEVIVHSVVGALDVVAAVILCDGQGVEDDLVAGELGAAAGEGEGLGGGRLLAVLARGGVEHIDDVDRADIPEGVVEMRVHGLAQGKGAPVGRVAELLLRVDQTGDLDRRVDDAGFAEAAHEVDGCRADIDRRGARLHGALCHSFADVAVGAVEVFVCHLLILLCMKLGQPQGRP